jgi:hypothetical protein
MSVVAQNTSVTYISTGSVGPYGFNFPISEPAALKVIVNGILIYQTLYTIVPVNNNYDNGGYVTLNSAPTAGQTVLLQRDTPLTQTSEFYDNMPQPMSQFEAGLDKLTEIAQEIVAAAGGGGGGSNLVPFAGVPIGTIDGTNRTFTLSNEGVALTSLPIVGTVVAWLNTPVIFGSGFTISGITITYGIAPQPSSGSIPADQIYVQGFVSS